MDEALGSARLHEALGSARLSDTPSDGALSSAQGRTVVLPAPPPPELDAALENGASLDLRVEALATHLDSDGQSDAAMSSACMADATLGDASPHQSHMASSCEPSEVA